MIGPGISGICIYNYTFNFRNQYAAEYDNIYSEYTILAAEMNENIRIFSLQDINNRLYFMQVKNKLKEAAEYSDRFKRQISNKGIVDGVVLNVMFEEMGLSEEFDAIEADFTIIFVQDDSRLDYLPENQLCVRKIDVINKIWKYNEEKVPDHYKVFINEYNQSKNVLRNKNSKSKINRAKMYKKRFAVNNKYNAGGK